MTVILFTATIVLFLIVDWVVRRVREPQAAGAIQPQALPVLRTPEGIFFARSHTWLSLFPSGKVRLGVDDFVGNLFEKPGLRFLKAKGDAVRKGEPLMVVEEGGRSVTVRSPLDGVIAGVNPALERSPDRMREQLFAEGWAFTVQPQRLQQLKDLLLGEDSRNWMKEELGRLRDLLAGGPEPAMATALQDGGMPARGLILHMSPEQAKQFDQEFLQVR